MKKNEKIQKKKTTLYSVLIVLIKILIIMIVVMFTLVAVQKLNLSEVFDFSDSRDKDPKRIPSELKWFDDFKGIENVPDKSKDGGESRNFMQGAGN